MVVRTVADIDEAQRPAGSAGVRAGVGHADRERVDRLDVLYGLGLRQIGIAYPTPMRSAPACETTTAA